MGYKNIILTRKVEIRFLSDGRPTVPLHSAKDGRDLLSPSEVKEWNWRNHRYRM